MENQAQQQKQPDTQQQQNQTVIQQMDISVDSEAFHVYVDNQHIFDFNHRYRPISDIKFLEVNDIFDLKEVTFN
ncbi:unnamed protein product [Clavelina lepadiformis]|uniref:Galectin n=1 Tax=Clavelina lepadiformis TaxID=159417 RepID=A0ABP0GBA5_CLALP